MAEPVVEAVVASDKAGDDAAKAASGDATQRGILPALRDVTLVATIYLFFAGFAYRYFYLRLLGVAPSEIDLSVNVLLVYAFNVFLNLPWLPVAIVAVLAALSVPKVRAVVDVAMLPLLAATAFGAFFILFVGARGTAVRAVAVVRAGNAVPAVVMKMRDDGRYDADFLAAAAGPGRNHMTAYLVEQNASTYFLLLARDPPDAGRPDRLYAIPRSEVYYLAALLPP
jgi:hypothetical protein